MIGFLQESMVGRLVSSKDLHSLPGFAVEAAYFCSITFEMHTCSVTVEVHAPDPGYPEIRVSREFAVVWLYELSSRTRDSQMTVLRPRCR
jgi:hypothetical protein